MSVMPFVARGALRAGFAAASVAAVIGLAGCGNNDPSSMPGMDHGSSGPGQPSMSALPAVTPSASTRTPASGPHNDADVMFAQMMIPHHQQAVEMSDIVLADSGMNPGVTALADQIKAAQAPEIAQMTGWLAGWGESTSPDADHAMGDGGMMSQADMDALERADGTDAAKLFLAGMIKHHQGAVAMAEDEVADGQSPDAVALAKKIITDQKAEIATMKQLLQQL